MKKLLPLALLATVALAMAYPAAAGKPEKSVFSFDDPEFEAFAGGLMTQACGSPIVADAKGKVIFIVHDRTTSRGVVEINAYGFRIVFTNTVTGASTTIVDAGPDLIRFDPDTGHVLLAITGRSTTGSGVIGRVVIDLDTGEVVSMSGLGVGDWIANTCAAIA